LASILGIGSMLMKDEQGGVLETLAIKSASEISWSQHSARTTFGALSGYCLDQNAARIVD